MKNKYASWPLGTVTSVENFVADVPFGVRKRIVTIPGIRNFLRATLVAFK